MCQHKNSTFSALWHFLLFAEKVLDWRTQLLESTNQLKPTFCQHSSIRKRTVDELNMWGKKQYWLFHEPIFYQTFYLIKYLHFKGNSLLLLKISFLKNIQMGFKMWPFSQIMFLPLIRSVSCWAHLSNLEFIISWQLG